MTNPKTTKKQACMKAFDELVKHYENVTFSTFYRHTVKLQNGNWQYYGKAHDYTF